MNDTLKISEIFSSVQGEGFFQGQKHLFVRLYGCSLRCDGCDEHSEVYDEVGVDDLFKQILSLDRNAGPHNYVSITGGEPLEQSTMLIPLLQLLRSADRKVLLETNGVLNKEFLLVKDWIDVVSFDFKLSSVWGVADLYESHSQLLECMDNTDFYIKVVLSKYSAVDEFMDFVKLLSSYNNRVPFILHPYMDSVSSCDSSLINLMLDFQRRSLEYLTDVRVLPRIHNLFKLR